jgi:hypothetical protein
MVLKMSVPGGASPAPNPWQAVVRMPRDFCLFIEAVIVAKNPDEVGALNDLSIRDMSHTQEASHDALSVNTRGRGQSLIEFALALPLLMLLVLGLIEMGRLIYIYSAVTTASRDAARYGFSLGEDDLGVPHYQDCSGIRAAAKAATGIAGIEDAAIEINYDSGPGTEIISSCPPSSVQTGTRIVVQVTASYEPIVPLVELPSIDITSTSRRTILVDIDAVQ